MPGPTLQEIGQQKNLLRCCQGVAKSSGDDGVRRNRSKKTVAKFLEDEKEAFTAKVVGQ